MQPNGQYLAFTYVATVQVTMIVILDVQNIRLKDNTNEQLNTYERFGTKMIRFISSLASDLQFANRIE